MIFDAPKVYEIRKQAVEAGLYDDGKRKSLFFPLTADYVAGLREAPDIRDQILLDLQAMSQSGWVGDVLPMSVWLRNAAARVEVFPIRKAYFTQCAELAEKTPRPKSADQQQDLGGTPRPAKVSTQEEKNPNWLLFGGVGVAAACLLLAYVSLGPWGRLILPVPTPTRGGPTSVPDPTPPKPAWIPVEPTREYVNDSIHVVSMRNEPRLDAKELYKIPQGVGLRIGGQTPKISRAVIDKQAWLKVSISMGDLFVLESELKQVDDGGVVPPVK